MRELSRRGIYLGTSSWKYPGWAGLVYRRDYTSDKDFNENCLKEYSEVYSCVGIDHTYYAWPNLRTLVRYHEQTPADFRFVLKATEKVTITKYPNLKRYGKDAGKSNSDFLNAELFLEKFIEPSQALGEKLGPIIFEFSQFYPGMIESGRVFTEKLDAFLAEVKRHYSGPLCVELRNQSWLVPDYLKGLSARSVGHTFNSWTRMPALDVQAKLAEPFSFPFYLARLLLEPGTKYAEAVEAFSPYDRTQNEVPAVRTAAAGLIRQALERKIPAYIIVNNRLEGCAPKTIEGILAELKISNPELFA